MNEVLDLRKVISGGQTGADQGGLRIAKALGIPTGGWLPKGCITLDGPQPALLEEYNMQEHPKEGYALRTEANVRDSDGTIRFATNFKSPGEKCTLKAINWFKKPHIDVDLNDPRPWHDVVFWIAEHRIRTLNVAGNSEQTSPGIGDKVYEYLLDLLPHCVSTANIEAVLKSRYNLTD
jgi:hypothetical protein